MRKDYAARERLKYENHNINRTQCEKDKKQRAHEKVRYRPR